MFFLCLARRIFFFPQFIFWGFSWSSTGAVTAHDDDDGHDDDDDDDVDREGRKKAGRGCVGWGEK